MRRRHRQNVDCFALVAASDGSLFVADRDSGGSGAVVVRLGRTAALERSFGKDGEAWVDMPFWNEGGIIRDIRPLAEGDIVLAGGIPDASGFASPVRRTVAGKCRPERPGCRGREAIPG